MLKSNSTRDNNTCEYTNKSTFKYAFANDPEISNTEENQNNYMKANNIDNIYYNSPVKKQKKYLTNNNKIDYLGNINLIDTINPNETKKLQTTINNFQEDKLNVNEINVYFSNKDRMEKKIDANLKSKNSPDIQELNNFNKSNISGDHIKLTNKIKINIDPIANTLRKNSLVSNNSLNKSNLNGTNIHLNNSNTKFFERNQEPSLEDTPIDQETQKTASKIKDKKTTNDLHKLNDSDFTPGADAIERKKSNSSCSNYIQETIRLTNAPDSNYLFSIKGFNNFVIGFQDKERRYDITSIHEGKDYYKYRFISESILREQFGDEGSKIHVKNRRSTNNSCLSFFKKVSSDNKSSSELINRERKSSTASSNFKFHYAPGDKKVIKLNKIFLQKLEKAIFLFNIKSYDESFEYLRNNKLIKDESEFAELILLTPGFDKNIIGIFLSSEKSPNKNFKILEFYMKKISFVHMKFTDSLRFLLSRLNLPKDSSLILKIIEAFSKTFYQDNKDSSIYPDEDSVYLLCSSVLALNTIISRLDLKNAMNLSKADFVIMNDRIERRVVEDAYDDIVGNKLDIVYEYNEMIYKRLAVVIERDATFFLSEKGSEDSYKKFENCVKVINPPSSKNSENFEDLAKSIKNINVIPGVKKNSKEIKEYPVQDNSITGEIDNSEINQKNINNFHSFGQNSQADVRDKITSRFNPAVENGLIKNKFQINLSNQNQEQNLLSNQSNISNSLPNNHEGKLYQDTNNINKEEMIKILRKGEIFLKYGKRGKPHLKFVKLSDDGTEIRWRYKSVCANIFNRTKSIPIGEIKEVYIGAQNSKKFERFQIPIEFDRFCLTIETVNRTFDLRKDNERVCKAWYLGIKYLINQRNSLGNNELQADQNKNSNLIFQKNNYNLPKDNLNMNLINNLETLVSEDKKSQITFVWKNEILPKWKDFRIHLEAKMDFHLSNPQIYQKKKKIIERRINDLSKNSKNNKHSILNEKDKSDFVFFFTNYGIPNWLRKSLYIILIKNSLNVSEILFDKFLKKVEPLELEWNEMKQSFECMMPDSVLEVGKEEAYKSNSQEKNSIIDTNSNSFILREIITDIEKSFKKFRIQIFYAKFSEKQFKLELFKILRVFTLERADIPYFKNLAYMAILFLLNSENYYKAYLLLVNFICFHSDFLLKYQIRDELFIKTRVDFFERMFYVKLPKLFKHFKNLDISTNLFFYDWVEFIFLKCFSKSFESFRFYHKLFDLFLIRGEVFLYELGICLIQVQQKELLSVSYIITIIIYLIVEFSEEMSENFEEISF